MLSHIKYKLQFADGTNYLVLTDTLECKRVLNNEQLK